MFITVCSAVRKVVLAEWFVRKFPFGVKVFRESCELLPCDNQNISFPRSHQLSPAPTHTARGKRERSFSSKVLLKTSAQSPAALLVTLRYPGPPKSPPDGLQAGAALAALQLPRAARRFPQGTAVGVSTGGGLSAAGFHTATRKIRLLKGRKAEI